MPTQTRESRLEELIAQLDGRSDSPNGMLREHLEAARFNLLNSMLAEYELTLKLARNTLPLIQDAQLRTRVEAFLDHPSDAQINTD